jgi:hypothetical protein
MFGGNGKKCKKCPEIDQRQCKYWKKLKVESIWD